MNDQKDKYTFTGIRLTDPKGEVHEPKTFGELVKLGRKLRGLTQAKLAERAGLSRVGVASVETGLFPDPHISTVTAILAALKIEISMTATAEADSEATE